MSIIVYTLCALTSLACSILLLRGYKSSKYKLLLWIGIGFVGFTVSNILLILDQNVVHDYDLSIHRTVPALLGMMFMVYSLIVEDY